MRTLITASAYNKLLHNTGDFTVVPDSAVKTGKGLMGGDLVLAFGDRTKEKSRLKDRHVTILSSETGFLHGCCHIDFKGLYDKSSLFVEGIEGRISGLSTPAWESSVEQFKERCRSGESKYAQSTREVNAENFVMIMAQKPKDSQIRIVNDELFSNNFLEFVRQILAACKDGGKKAIIKSHPSGLNEEISREAVYFGVPYEIFSMTSGLARCERVVTYNSTSIIDSMVSDKPVFMMGPGYWTYFSNCLACPPGGRHTAASASNWAVASDVKFCRQSRDNLLGFLLNEYCIRRRDPAAIRRVLTSVPRPWEREAFF